MAISIFEHYNLLDTWREYCLENVWHFNQLTGRGATKNACDVYVQPDRDVVARAIKQAFDKMTRYLNYPPAPIWCYDDIPFGSGYPLERQELKLRYGHVQAVGRRATTLIQAGVAITYSDVGGLGVNDTATIAVTVAATDPTDEVCIFFRTADGAPSAAHAQYEILPVTRSRAGNVVTLVTHRANCVEPNGLWAQPYESPDYQEINAGDTTVAADFITLVDVYRVYADDSTAVTLVGDNWVSGGGCSANCDDDTCTGCARLVDSELGIVQIRSETCTCCLYPERVRIYYKAGYPLSYGKLDPDFMSLIRLANTMMPRQPCAVCNRYHDVFATDRVVDEGNIPAALVNNPFGIKNGELAAWLTVREMAQVGAGKLTKGQAF